MIAAMDDHPIRPSSSTSERRQRLAEMARLQEIEGNPFDAEDIAMFEMFEREGWSEEAQRAYVIAHIKAPAAK
jgi:hypothetical protein